MYNRVRITRSTKTEGENIEHLSPLHEFLQLNMIYDKLDSIKKAQIAIFGLNLQILGFGFLILGASIKALTNTIFTGYYGLVLMCLGLIVLYISGVYKEK